MNCPHFGVLSTVAAGRPAAARVVGGPCWIRTNDQRIKRPERKSVQRSDPHRESGLAGVDKISEIDARKAMKAAAPGSELSTPGAAKYGASEHPCSPNPIGTQAGSRLIIDTPVVKAYRSQPPVGRSELSSRPDSDARGHRSCHRDRVPSLRERKSRRAPLARRAAIHSQARARRATARLGGGKPTSRKGLTPPAFRTLRSGKKPREPRRTRLFWRDTARNFPDRKERRRGRAQLNRMD